MRRRGFLKTLLAVPFAGLAVCEKTKAEPKKQMPGCTRQRDIHNVFDCQMTLTDLIKRDGHHEPEMFEILGENNDILRDVTWQAAQRRNEDRRFLAEMEHSFIRKLFAPRNGVIAAKT